jgi:NADH-quinone oxidoreductase subunit J
MTAGIIIFLIVGTIAVVAALGMLLSQNAVHAALFLILNFACVAVFYLLLNAPFLAMVQITVYAGAIMVLFLFVIMLLGAERVPLTSTLRWQAPLGVALALLLLGTAAFAIISGGIDLSPPELASEAETFGGPFNVGEVLFESYLLPFELTSVLLLVAMIGAVVLTKDEEKSSQQPATSGEQRRSEAPAAD